MESVDTAVIGSDVVAVRAALEGIGQARGEWGQCRSLFQRGVHEPELAHSLERLLDVVDKRLTILDGGSTRLVRALVYAAAGYGAADRLPTDPMG